MSDTSQNVPKTNNPRILLIVLIVVVIAALGYGIYALLTSSTNGNSTANTAGKTNVTKNVNTNVPSNANSASSIGNNSNINVVSNTNSSVAYDLNLNVSVPSDWKTYEDPQLLMTFRYPKDMQIGVFSATGEIAYRAPNEWVTLFKLIKGTPSEALDWINSRPGLNVKYTATDKTLLVAGVVAPIYSNGKYGNYAVADFKEYVLIAHIVDYIPEISPTLTQILASVKHIPIN